MSTRMHKSRVKSILITCLHCLMRLAIQVFSLTTVLQLLSCVGECLCQTDSRLTAQDVYKQYLFLSSTSLIGQPTCLEHALMQIFLLKRKNISTQLCLGVSASNKNLVAHAWLSYKGVVLGNNVELKEFIQVYPIKKEWE